MQFFHACINYTLQFLQIDLLTGRDKEAIILHLCHPSLHQFLECQVFLCSGGKVVSRFLHIGVSVYFIEYKYDWLTGCTDIRQCFIDYFYLFFKIRM